MKSLHFLAASLLCAVSCFAQPAALTPDQQRLENTLRNTMTWCSLPEIPVQDAVVACALAEESALLPVRDAQRKVTQAMVDKENRGAQMATLLNDWRATVEDAKDKRASAIAELKKKVDFTKQPVLEAFLTVTGLIGDETGFLIGPEGHLLFTLGNLAGGGAKK